MNVMKAMQINRRRVPRVFLTQEQREKIKKLYKMYGNDYSAIARIMQMPARKVREHILANIKNVESKTFTPDEDYKLLYCVDKYGHKWAAIAEFIGTKSAMLCRNRYKFIQSKLKSQAQNQIYFPKIAEVPQPDPKVVLPPISHIETLLVKEKPNLQFDIKNFLCYPIL